MANPPWAFGRTERCVILTITQFQQFAFLQREQNMIKLQILGHLIDRTTCHSLDKFESTVISNLDEALKEKKTNKSPPCITNKSALVSSSGMRPLYFTIAQHILQKL
uniref:Uncharacterized protein n=1 Tax=Nelumbo nucifera TaxID=4432 RepID=A0A822YKV3_NELNU|nr:TPA_asm: hypothetical protein HUJ06_010771 [Nelumbo nucifera]